MNRGMHPGDEAPELTRQKAYSTGDPDLNPHDYARQSFAEQVSAYMANHGLNDGEQHPEDMQPTEAPSVATIAKDWAERQLEKVLSADNDPINHPSHYTQYPVEVIEITEHMNFNRGNAVKYIARAGHKDPKTEIEDLKKAKWYITREIGRVIREGSDQVSEKVLSHVEHEPIQPYLAN